MELDFVKMHGAGNDFIFIDDLSEDRELSVEQVRFLCDRHVGIGADGVILVRPSGQTDCVAYMHYINDDGSLAEMCGNGVRCFAKYLVDRGFVAAGEGRLVADTLAGRRVISFETDADGMLTQATVDMGEPAFEPQRIPTTLEANSTVAGKPAVVEAELSGPSPLSTPLRFTCVNMGNPHAVAFPEGDESVIRTLDWGGQGRELEHHPAFPERANIELARVIRPGSAEEDAEIEMRVWERGVGETLACGTGACATAVAAVVTGRAARRAVVHLPGGDLRIEWLENNHVMMTGPATTVYEGTILL
jgi:diaminopimelate epimerase